MDQRPTQRMGAGGARQHVDSEATVTGPGPAPKTQDTRTGTQAPGKRPPATAESVKILNSSPLLSGGGQMKESITQKKPTLQILVESPRKQK